MLSDKRFLIQTASQLPVLQRPAYLGLALEATQWAPRDLRRDLRGEQHPWLALEARPDSPGESGTPP